VKGLAGDPGALAAVDPAAAAVASGGPSGREREDRTPR
jgi:hypothetical protein